MTTLTPHLDLHCNTCTHPKPDTHAYPIAKTSLTLKLTLTLTLALSFTLTRTLALTLNLHFLTLQYNLITNVLNYENNTQSGH